MAMNLGLLADNWGDAPYSDALTGEILRPTYDTAEELYATIFSLLTQAERDFDNDDQIPTLDGDSDFIHGGDLDAWRLTINALRARYLNHYSETGQYDPSAVLSAVDAAYSGTTDNAALTTFEVRSPWAQVALNNDGLNLDGWLSEQFVDALNGMTFGTSDPRLPLLTAPDTNGVFVGTVNGAGRAGGDGTIALQSYLEQDGAKSSADSPLDIITFTELKFIEAEAALADGNTTRARTAFEAGITADMQRVGVDSAGIVNYITAEYGTSGVSRADIFREKYVALFLHPETWVDARRYDYAYREFMLSVNATLMTFPARVPYPNSELDRNLGNVPNTTQTDPIFWDQ